MAVDRVRLREALAGSAQGHGPGLFGLVVDDGNVVFYGSVGVADLRVPRGADRPRPKRAELR